MKKKLSTTELVALMELLRMVVRRAANEILALGKHGAIHLTDTRVHKGHEESSLDTCARAIVERIFHEVFPDFYGDLFFESDPYKRAALNLDHVIDSCAMLALRVAIFDELDGTTNSKRGLSSPCIYTPEAGVSAALGLSEVFGDIAIASFAMFDGTSISSIRCPDGAYLTYENERMITPTMIQPIPGDSVPRVAVVGYSNTHYLQLGQLMQAISDAGIKPYGGCRTTGVDLAKLIRGQFDGYIDLRWFWPTFKADSQVESMLQIYDCAGMIPCCLGTGMKAWAPGNVQLDQCRYDWAIPLVVCRAAIAEKIEKAISPLTKSWLKALPKDYRERKIA